MTVGEIGEAELIGRIVAAHGDPPASAVPEDAATLFLKGPVVVSVDAFVEGVHFDLVHMEAWDVGWRSMMAALSDLAAVAATPHSHLLSLALPSETPEDTLAQLAAGLAAAAQTAGSGLIGGNVTASGQIHIDLTVIGRSDGVVPRRQGEPGDLLVVTGPLGLAAQGRAAVLGAEKADADATRAFLRPEARLVEGRLLKAAGARSLTDITDGLAIELFEVMGPDARGARLSSEGLLGGRGPAALPFILKGGEDYELVAALPPGALEEAVSLFTAAKLSGLRPIGTLTRKEGLWLDGRALGEAWGWDPFWRQNR